LLVLTGSSYRGYIQKAIIEETSGKKTPCFSSSALLKYKKKMKYENVRQTTGKSYHKCLDEERLIVQPNWLTINVAYLSKKYLLHNFLTLDGGELKAGEC